MARREYLGLCSICLHNAECVFTGKMEHSVVHCEEFQADMPAAGQSARMDFSKDFFNKFSNDTGFPHGRNNGSNQGLCHDCESRHTCGLITTPEGGVWYCEEYR